MAPVAAPSAEKIWIVIGGLEKGGIVCREGCQLDSPPKTRLAIGAKVREVEVVGIRLRFVKVDGDGPADGWVSLSLKGKPLLELDASGICVSKALVAAHLAREVADVSRDVWKPPEASFFDFDGLDSTQSTSASTAQDGELASDGGDGTPNAKVDGPATDGSDAVPAPAAAGDNASSFGGNARERELVDRVSTMPSVDHLQGFTVRQVLFRNEPSYGVLDAWARNSIVNDILTRFTLHGAVGKASVMTLADVRDLLAAASISPRWVVSKFKDGFLEKDIDETFTQILRRFSSHAIKGKLVLRFRDVFRLLEALDVNRRRFVKIFSETDEDEFLAYDQFGRLRIFRDLVPGRSQRPPKPKIGNFYVDEGIGEGLQGGVVFRAKHVQTTKTVALKWPVLFEELEAMKAIQRLAGSSAKVASVPDLLESGYYEGKPYAATSLLGADLTKVFDRLQPHSCERRWPALRVFGRLLLRRLETVHRCGYVHCDVSPLNVLLGPARGAQVSGDQALLLVPYFIDFGQAKKHPGERSLLGDKGSMEWSSIRSAEGGIPTPEDDLEALGWVLVYGFSGDLPWFDLLSKHYAAHSPPTRAPPNVRDQVIRRVREAKEQFLDKGWQSFDAKWSKLKEVPEGLLEFIQLCRSGKLSEGHAGYEALAVVLGGKADLEEREAEKEDLRHYDEDVLPLL